MNKILTENEINNYLNKYDWNKPWSAGAQFSGLCVFVSTQLDDNLDGELNLIEFKRINRINEVI